MPADMMIARRMENMQKDGQDVVSEQKVSREYKDKLLRAIFKDKRRALELCNAVTNSNYSKDTEVRICDLDSALFRRYNDLAFAIDNQLLLMVEHQSTINPNLPLRFLSYVTDILYSWFVKVDEIHGRKLHKIPAPKLYVFYNGKEEWKEKTLKLSDAFYINDEKVSLELEVEIIDVRYSTGHEVLQRSKSLEGYSYLIEQVEVNLESGCSLDEAVSSAIDLSIRKDYLSEWLRQNYQEAAKMITLQYDQEAEYRVIREESREEGRVEGKKEGRVEIATRMLESGMTASEVVKISGLPLDVVKNLRG